MRIVLLDALTLGEVSNLTEIERFGELVKYKVTKPEETLSRLIDAEIVITNKVVIDKAMMKACPKLKLICVAATGTNNIDLEGAKELGISVKNVAGYSTKSVAQHTFTLLFSLLGQIKYYDEYVKSGGYVESPIFTHLQKEFWEISGKTLGIIGLGTIGREVAKIAQVFGMKVIYYSTSGENNNQNYSRVDITDLLRQSDVITIHAPLNDKTTNLISKPQFGLMKPTAIVLNTGRGGIIDEEALIAALNNELIAAAGLDVLMKEPMVNNHPILKLKNKEKLIVTPHIAWASKEARHTLIDGIVKNIETYISEN